MTRFLMALVVIVVIAFFTVPIGEWMVDDRYLYRVHDMREIFPESNYKGQKFGDNVELIEFSSSTSEKLSYFGYLMAKRAKALGKKI